MTSITEIGGGITAVLWQQNSNVHGKAANQPRIANDPLKCLHWRTLHSLSQYLPTFDLQGHILKVIDQVGANKKNLKDFT